MRIGECVIQHHEIPHKDTLELYAVSSAVGLAGGMQAPIHIGEMREPSSRNRLGRSRECRIRRDFVEFGKTAKNDALVVSPGVLLIVLAGGEIKTVIDKVLRVDHA